MSSTFRGSGSVQQGVPFNFKASDLSIVDVSDHYSGNNVEDALQEAGADILARVTSADLASTSTGLGAALIGYKAATTGRTVETKLDEMRKSVLDYGAVGDGVTDDRDAFEAMLSQSGRYFVPSGTYRVDTAISPSASNIDVLFASDAVIDFTNAAKNIRIFDWIGSEGTPVALTANATETSTSVSVAAGAEAAFSEGDWVLLRSEDVYDSQNVGVFAGELLEVNSTSSGSITFKTALQGGTYNTANSAEVVPITQYTDLVFRGGKFIGRQDDISNDNFQTGLKFHHCRNVLVEDSIFDGINATGIIVRHSPFVTIRRCEFRNAQRPSSGYGIDVVDTSQQVLVDDCNFSKCRHAFTTGNSGGDYGVIRGVTVQHCRVESTVSTGDALDTHGAAEDINFLFNTIHSSASQGINLECTSGSIIGNRVIGSASNGISFHPETDRIGNVIIADNRVFNAGSSGIRAEQGARGTPTVTPRSIIIVNNLTVNSTDNGIRVTRFNIDNENVIVGNNYVDSAGSIAGGIYVEESSNVAISGNNVAKVVEDGAGIGVFDVEHSSISANTIEFDNPTSGHTGWGIRVNNGTVTQNVSVLGNTVRNLGDPGSIDGANVDIGAIGVIISDNIFENVDYGVRADADETVISNNQFFSCTAQAIYVKADNCSVLGNYIDDNTSATSSIYFDTVTGFTCSNNHIKDAQADGIEAWNSEDGIISNNMIRFEPGSTVGNAIHLNANAAHTDVSVLGNMFKSPGGAGTTDGVLINANMDWVLVDGNNFRAAATPINPPAAAGNNVYGTNI